MASGAPVRDMYVPHIKVSAVPDLVSNFQFLDYTEVANDVASLAHNCLKELHYQTELDQHLTGAGGPGMLPNLLELIQTLWDNKALIMLPFTIAKFFYARFKTGFVKMPVQSRKLAKITVCLQAYSSSLLLTNGVYVEKESTLNSMLDMAVAVLPVLNERYPQVHFSFQLEVKLDEHRAQLLYCFEEGILRIRRIPVLFHTIPLHENTSISVRFVKHIFFKRIDTPVSRESSGAIWSYDLRLKSKTYYFIFPGRLMFKDYRRLTSREPSL